MSNKQVVEELDEMFLITDKKSTLNRILEVIDKIKNCEEKK